MLKNKNLKIGFFDSGLGGLSIYQNFLNYLIENIKPNNDYLPIELFYIADSKYAPYGLKSTDFIEKRALEICQFLLEKEVDIIVIACNTATAHAIDGLRKNPLFKNIPLVGVEPAVKPACLQTKNNKIGILATKNTLESTRLAKLMNEQKMLNPNLEFFCQEGKGWVQLIESETILSEIRTLDSEQIIWQHIRNSIQPFIESNIDTLILGCTHYPFLEAIIQKNIPSSVKIINNASAITQQIMRLITLINMDRNIDIDTNSFISSQNIYPKKKNIQQSFYSNGDLLHMQNFVESILTNQLNKLNKLNISQKFNPFNTLQDNLNIENF